MPRQSERALADFDAQWQAAVAAAATDDGRRYVDAVKRAAHTAAAAIGSGTVTDPTTLENMRRALQDASRVAGFPGEFRRAANKVASAMLAARGITVVETLIQKRGMVAVDGGLLRVGDPKQLEALIGVMPDIADIAEGRVAYVSTGCDGLFPVILRLVSAPEPVLTPKEFSKSLGATAPMVIAVDSGKIACQSDVDKSPYKLSLDVAPGRYAVVCHVFGKGFLFVMARTEAPVGTIALEIETLEGVGGL